MSNRTKHKSKSKRLNAKNFIPVDHTKRAYLSLSEAYLHFNGHLFKGKLPTCVITMQRKNGMAGYFWKDKFINKNKTTDELALNPSGFVGRSDADILSTLVHEMAHVWQFHFGAASPNGYHNKEWGAKMKEIGLYPSSTGKANGKEVGFKMSHYILNEGAFKIACNKFLKLGTLQLYQDAFGDSKKRKRSAISKTKFTCDECGVNAWGKPDLNINCNECDTQMISENGYSHNHKHNYRKAA